MLKDTVAVVAGANRGCGRGIALAPGEAGFTVYVTGRTVRSGRKPRGRSTTSRIWRAKYGFTDVDGQRVGNFYRALGMMPRSH